MGEELTDRKMLYETYVGVQSLEKRMDIHGRDLRDGMDGINNKIDSLRQKIQEVEISAVKSDRDINVKIASISGTVSFVTALIVAIASAFIERFTK